MERQEIAVRTPWQVEEMADKNEKKNCFNAFNGAFFLLFKQGAPHFHSALGPANVQPAPVTRSPLTGARTARASDPHSPPQALFPRQKAL